MHEPTMPALSEDGANVVENLAVRVAETAGGTITVNHLAPYLPMSLEMIRAVLDEMVDGHTVQAGEAEGFPAYTFAAAGESWADDGDFRPEALWEEAAPVLEPELTRLAESGGWPARAVYEHEILYLMSRHASPHYGDELAGRSRYTLKRLKRKLNLMTRERWIRQDVDAAKATVAYAAPEIDYPRDLYRRNMAFIRQHPASVTEDVEMKVTRVLLILGLMLLVVLGLAFCRVPMALLLPGYAVAGAVVSAWVWLKRDAPPDT